MDELTEKINRLARKERTVGLTDKEKAEQAELREKFRRRFRAGFASELENTVVETPDGKKRKLTELAKDKKQLKNGRGNFCRDRLLLFTSYPYRCPTYRIFRDTREYMI